MVKRVVITGPESTGKSVLAKRLASVYDKAVYVPEYARVYVERLPNHDYTKEDVEAIANFQLKQEANIDEWVEWVFFDTWFIVTKVWFEVVYGCCPSWIDDHIKRSKIDMFLVCDIDLPWEPDPVRACGGEDGEKKRKALFEKYCSELEHYAFDYRVVKGSGRLREKSALEAINSL